jgi:hypothetical protein
MTLQAGGIAVITGAASGSAWSAVALHCSARWARGWERPPAS